VARALERGVPLVAISRHMLGLAHGRPRARAFRRLLSDGARVPGAGLELYDQAAALLAPPDLAEAA
jgi:tRNA-dihydrouridine synthase A